MSIKSFTQIEKLNAKHITKPIQLIAFLLLSIIIIPMFLYSATQISQPTWVAPFLVVSSVMLVLIFFILIFLFQTKFRIQMLEDDTYSTYLKNKTENHENLKKLSYMEKMNIQHIEMLRNLNDRTL